MDTDMKYSNLEQLFTRLEEESRQRAEEAESQWTPEPILSVAAKKAQKERRRGSVSISRLGSLSDVFTESGRSTPITPPAVSPAAVNPLFYQAQYHNGSQDSFASNTTVSPDQLVEDEMEVRQVQKIAGRPTLSQVFSRRISRRISRTDFMLPVSETMISVSVASTTVETEHAEPGTSFVTAGAAVVGRGRSQTVSSISGSSWAAKAKDLTMRIRRKSVMGLTPSAPASS